MTKEQNKAAARELFTLASKCKVPMLRACKRIGMATSTPHRWLRNGSAPGGGQVSALRASILRTADERGTLPDQYLAEFRSLGDEAPPPAHRPPQEIARELARGIAELQESLAAGED